MDFRVSETVTPACETVVNAVSELPVDGDFILPEYCPDVAAVLKCQMTATVQSRTVSGDRLAVDGTVALRVLYLDEERHCVRVCEFAQPFNTVFSLPPLSPKAFVCLRCDTDYVNCRAISPRRLDIHGAFTVGLTVTDVAEQRVITALEGDGVYTRRVLLACSVPAAFQEKSFTINEVLEAGAGHHPAEAMLYTTATPLVNECKVLLNKAIIKGVLQVYALYVTDAANGATEEAEVQIPFSQIIDMEGLNEEWICDATVTASAVDVHTDVSQSGDTVLLAVSAKLLCSLYGWCYESVETVCDAYCAHYPLQLETHSITTAQLHAVQRDEPTVRQTCELPSEDVQEILGVWCTVVSAGMSGEADQLKLDGRLNWCALTRDTHGEIAYFERTEPFAVAYGDGGRDDTPQVQVCRTEHQVLGNGQIEMRATLSVTRRCVHSAAHRVLSRAQANEAAAYPPDKAALKIVYAEKGESLWDIARRSRTAMEAIMEENHITGDVLTADTMLLIPLC